MLLQFPRERNGFVHFSEALVCIALLFAALWLVTDNWIWTPLGMIFVVIIWVLLS